MQNSKITKISDREHLHLRKELYIGNCNTVKEKHWMLDSSMNLKYTETLYNEGYIKLVYEIIDNSIDEYIKTGGKFSNKIDVDISDEKSVTVIDNGRGIPSSKDKATGKYQTELAFCDLKAGSNWERTSSIGMNGIGGSAVNMLSSSFIVNSCDGKYTSSLGCSGNCDSIKFKRTKGGKKGTKVVFSIDEKHFDGAQYFNVDIIRNIVLKRLLILNTTYKKIKLTFNGHKITNTIWDCLAISDGLFVNKGDIDINVYPIGSVKYDDISTINGLDTYRGGTHLRYIKSEIMTYVRDKINKKHKLNIKNSDLYDKFMFGVMFRDFPIPEFNTQNKTELINKEADVREYIKKNGLNLDDIAKKLYSTFSKEISEIVDMFQYKSIAKKSKSVAKGKKDVKRLEQFIDAVDKNRTGTTLFIVEGDSAKGHFTAVRDKNKHGMFPLKGKVLNAHNNSLLKVLNNEELTNLINIIGLEINSKKNTRYFDKIAILTDADVDGDHIATLLILFFYKYFPHVIQEGRLIKVLSPIIICRKGKKIHRFYEFEDYVKVQEKYSTWTVEYNKGLGSLDQKEYSLMINDIKYETLALGDDDAIQSTMKVLFDKDTTEKRKEWLQGKKISEVL